MTASKKMFVGGAKTEAGKNRRVTVSPKILPIVERIAAERGTGAFFADYSGKRFDLKSYRGVLLSSLRGCRHTFATLMKRVGGSDKDKMQLIGHTSTEMLRLLSGCERRRPAPSDRQNI